MTMNKYELALVINAKIEDDARTDAIEKIKALIEKFGGEITNVDEWGKKKLAYEIQKMREGYYYFIQFDASAECPAEAISEQLTACYFQKFKGGDWLFGDKFAQMLIANCVSSNLHNGIKFAHLIEKIEQLSVSTFEGEYFSTGVIVSSNFAKHFQGGKYAAYHFKGFPQFLFMVYQEIFCRWLSKTGNQLDERRPIFDIYRLVGENGYMEIDICFPLK